MEAVDLSGVPTKEIRIGRRFNVFKPISEGAETGWVRVGVIVSGPSGLCNDVGAAVASAGRKCNTVFELEVDAYS